jgi:iron complex transport system substrate-binding protein
MAMADVFPERIVSLSPSCTEILFAVGAGPKVVGVTDYCDYPDELKARIDKKEISHVGGYWNPSIETIVGLKPDLVLVSTAQCTVKTDKCKTRCSRRCELTLQAANKLKSCGLNVLILAPHSLSDVLDEILLVGKTTGNVATARELVENLKQRIDVAVAKSKTASCMPAVYFEVWNEPYISASSGTWIGDVISLAGGTNVFDSSVSEWPIIEADEIIRLNPDVMVFPVIADVPRFWESFEAVKKRRGWDKIAAVRDDCLFEVPRDFISRPGPRLVDALELLTEMLQECLNTP